MHTDELKSRITRILDEIDDTEPITEAPIEGEVIYAPKPTGVPLKWIMPIGLAALSLALISILVVEPLFMQSATVTITPISVPLQVTGSVTLPGRQLLTKSLTVSEQVPATGKGHQDATEAYGTVTLYNAYPAPQRVYAENAALTGRDGVPIILDSDVTIPGGTLATNGAVTVSAHAAIFGSVGNIPAGDVSGPCCQDYVFAYNNAFHEGRDAASFTTPSTQDIASARADLLAMATSHVSREAQGMLHATEAMTSPNCTLDTTSQPPAGTPAKTTMVTVATTCNIYAVSQPALNQQAQHLFTKELYKRYGSGYIGRGMQETVTNTKFGTNVTLTLSLQGTATYHFTDAQIQTMGRLIAGKNTRVAMAALLQFPGIHAASIDLTHGSTVPDTQHITIAVYEP